MIDENFELLAFISALKDGAHLTPQFSSEILECAHQSKIEVSQLTDWYDTTYSDSPKLTEELLTAARKRIERTLDLGIVCLPIFDERYPDSLRKVEGPPPILYVRGNMSIIKRVPGVAVVGTRKATVNGIKIAERIALHFSQLGWPIVSGLALGIDAAAHRGALKGMGSTIAVLAHGLDAASPRTNINLASEILERNGAWVSEYPVGIPAKPEQFVFRNRIQIGLAAGSVIVEGEVKSGSMTQAEYCLRNSRELFAVMEPLSHARLGLLDDGPKVLVEKRGAFAVHSRENYSEMEERLHRKRNLLLGHREKQEAH